MRNYIGGPLVLLLLPLALLFDFMVRLRVLLYNLGHLKSHRPPWPTLSIGNISAGGTGKTPLLFKALEWFDDNSATAAVLSRGYGGDEGILLRQRFPQVSLIENVDRVAGMRSLAENHQPEVLVLDDGFQHLRLQRDIDIVVVDATRPFGPVFPAGLFRESTRALRRADLVVVTRVDLVDQQRCDAIQDKIHKTRLGLKKLPRVEAKMRATHLRQILSGESFDLDMLRGVNAVLAAGIGNHQSFADLCTALGVNVIDYKRLADHHQWTSADVISLADADMVLVTEKDGVKLHQIASDKFYEVCVDLDFVKGAQHFEQQLFDLHLPVRAARIEPLWEGVTNVD
ncbi:MAG: tetraacyldisaccharide 4'-kinase [Planctomycetes bacterium]|nr:tetraacyldisaccharide 4'-kinase [Planctomycetota bacterium]